MSLPDPPDTVNESRLTTAHREALQRTRARALETYAVAGATAERLAALPGLDESIAGLAMLSERLAQEAFHAVDQLCTELDPDQTPVPEPIE